MSARPDIAAELERLREPDGLLLPEKVVAAARQPTSPLHSYFEWDESKAAEQFRLIQARNLIRAVVTIQPSAEGPITTRAYVSLPADRVNGGGYRAIEDVIDDPAKVAEALRDLELLLSRARSRFVQFRALTPLVDQMIGMARDARDGLAA